MKNKLFCLVLIGILSSTFSISYGQQNDTYFNTKGIIIYNSGSAYSLSKLDSAGNFIFKKATHPAALLWKYDITSKSWVKPSNQKAMPSFVFGRADLTAIPASNQVQTIYWKDTQSILWCLSANKDNLKSPEFLKNVWQGKSYQIMSKDADGKEIWRYRTQISIQY